MGVKINNFVGKNPNITAIERKGIFTVIEHTSDLSVRPAQAEMQYYMDQMGIRKHQVLVSLQNNKVRMKPGAMQVTMGNLRLDADTRLDLNDMFVKKIKSSATKNDWVKSLWTGTGMIITEPTYKHLIIEDIADWGGAVVLDDGIFVACDDEMKEDLVMGSWSQLLGHAVSSQADAAINLALRGTGQFVIEAPAPRDELYEIILDNDTVMIDGDYAICWSDSLNLSFEPVSRTLMGQKTKEGFANVYRGTGKILMAPV